MSIKYIRNTDDATIVCKIPSDKNKAFIFRTKKFDKRNNVLLSNGFTEISESDLALLKAESNTFKFYEKSGKLTVTDSLPLESMSAEQLIAALKTEIATLKAQLKTASKGESSKELKAAESEIADLANEINELRTKIEEQALTIKQLSEDPTDTPHGQYQKKIDELHAEITEKHIKHQEELKEAQNIIDALNEQIIDMQTPEIKLDEEGE